MQRETPNPAVGFLQEHLVRPLQEFFQTEVIGGILLLVSAGAALLCANTGLASFYNHLWEIPLQVGIGDFVIQKTFHQWINEGLMAVFFFLVGLEIKREILAGELASVRKAALPMVAALGGMVVPAALYSLMNVGGAGQNGWGIPMATDIAFALGALALLGEGVPSGILVFLAALAIADDLGAVLVIALFYGGNIAFLPLVAGGLILGISFLLNRLGVRMALVYAILGIILWAAFLKSGVHAAVAGVLLAMTIPTQTVLTGDQFASRVQRLIKQFSTRERVSDPLKRAEEEQAMIREIEKTCRKVEAPLQRIEHALHPWVTYVIMPIFAFANAGVEIPLEALQDALTHPVTLGIIIGLVIGKQLGIMLFSWAAIRMGWAELPTGATWKQIYGVSWLGGIGFTMSLFIAHLAFSDPALLDQSKIGILAGSMISGTIGYLLLRETTS